MNAPLSPEALRLLRERHVEVPHSDGYATCDTDYGQTWPCDSAELLATLAVARRASEAQVRFNDSHEQSGYTVAAEIAARGPLTLDELDRHFEAADDGDDGRATVSLDRADFNRLRAAARATLAPPPATPLDGPICPDCGLTAQRIGEIHINAQVAGRLAEQGGGAA